jgi:hypothetical protein
MPGAKILSFDWALWFQWIMATTLGWISGGLFLSGIPLIASGVAAGILQWLVLQGRLVRPWRWVLASAAGWIAGYLLTLFFLPAELDFLSGIILGLSVGLAQWPLLRAELHWSGWWVVFSVVGWTTGLNLLPGFLLTGISAGVFTGLALEILLRTPKPKPVKNSQTS